MKSCHAGVKVAAMFALLWCAPRLEVNAEEKGVAIQRFPEVLEAIRIKHQVPALAAAACIEGQVVEIAATGVRKIGSEERVSVDSQWHIGSCTKSMTASLAALLVEDGRVRWDTKVGEVLKDAPKLADGWREVTLEQLLQHRAGAPGNPPHDLWLEAWKQTGTPLQQRRNFVFGLLRNAPEFKPGTRFQYSNQGYAIAGAMLEQITGQPWEELMRTRLFTPLRMQSAGFGAPNFASQPTGHEGKRPPLRPVKPGIEADNPPSIGPAGTVHCSIADFARYAAWHADAGRSANDLLKPDTFTRLHQPAADGDYAMGWTVTKRGWAGGKTLAHDGSNTMWFAVMWVAPEKRAAFVAATNTACDTASSACDDAVAELISRTLTDAQRPPGN